MDVAWDVRVQSSHGVAGGAALLTCTVPSIVKNHVTVSRWFKDGNVLAPLAAEAGKPKVMDGEVFLEMFFYDTSISYFRLSSPVFHKGGRYIVGGSRSDILVVRDARPEDSSSYSCEAQHALTGEKRRSPAAMVTVSHASSSMAPRMLTVSDDEMVPQGGDIRLVCCAIGSPPPTYSWFRHSNGRLSPVSNSIRISVSDQVLIIRRAQLSDGGVWTCRAHNQFGEQRRDARLRVRSRLVVSVHPQLQVANSGSSVAFNCSVEGGDARVRWLHDGVPVGGGERTLRVHGVVRAHRGMYQCFAERDLDSAQAAAELRLGDTAPELHYTFIEQALHPGPSLALHCAASGNPPPRFTWLLDGQAVEEHNTAQRSISQFLNSNGDVVSYMNLTSVRPEDGGRYTCRAHNSRGAVEHSTRLNVYEDPKRHENHPIQNMTKTFVNHSEELKLSFTCLGPPSIRNIGPVRVVAGVNTTIYCPFSGFPISEIRWQRGGLDVSSTGGRALSGVGGELLLWPAEPADAGVYSCRVTSPSGQYAQKDVQIFVRNPPKIAGFSFPLDLVEGSSIQVLCGITSGDKPVYFSWLKDGQHIPSGLQVQEKSLDEFSFLIFSHVTSKHSGDYTCVASNSAAEVNHTARLAVKVAPSWVYEPQDVSALLGTQILVHCSTKGYPEPRISWLKGHGSGVSDFRPVSNLDLQFSVLPNGTLSIAPAAHHHEGQYMCRAENGIGRGLSKIIAVSVNEPAHFEFSSRNMTVKRTAQATLQCDARGDPPIQLQWTHNMKRVDLTTYRVSVSEKRSESGVSSQLSIAHAERHDSGVYRCRAENAYGRDELLIYLAVQEFPEAPVGLHVSRRSGRGASLSWRRGYDGNARVLLYRLQYRVVGDTRRPDAGDWADAPTRDVPAERVVERQDLESGSEVNLEYRVEGLRPATAYALRLAAVNAIGDSDYSEPVIVQTLEEAPSEPPHNVQVQATAPGELLVKWQAPPQESWNGELLGYVVTWHEASSLGDNKTSALTAAGWGAAHAVLVSLRTHAQYEVRVRAFNAVGAGPPCAPLTATTLEGAPEGPPERVRCEPLSAQSVRVWWEPPPPALRGGVLLGYEVLYETVDELESQVETRRSGGMETVLQALQRAANYSIAVRARTAAGTGPTSEPVYCATHEDIPGAPMDIKAVANSEDTVIVSWLAPLQKNGKIKHYTVYNRPQRTGQHSHIMVLHTEEEEEYQVEVKGLQEHIVYEFWVTAATSSGEGEMSAIVARKPNPRAPAKITSFGRRLEVKEGSRARVTCAAAGAPPPHRAWSRRRPAPPLAHDANFLIDGPYLIILRYILEYCRSDASRWQQTRLPADTRTHSLERLACGTLYKVRLTAYNAVGSSPPSDELIVSTKGGPSKASPEKDLITTNSTCVRLNLLTWDSNGCPLTQFSVSVRSFEESSWMTQTVSPAAQPTVICGLTLATWYHLKVVAVSAAGTTLGNYYFSTLTENGASCFRKGYEQGDISEEEDKSVEKRDNRRNCQQVYTSSPIKHPIGKKDQQDEYTLSRAMTLMVRRSESDSDSSGSPCAECNSSVSYRMPVTPGKVKLLFFITIFVYIQKETLQLN
ncbi:hypothetical protein HW555_003429 [Spodoptera exigua]|uniref:Hemolin n=1 Tax=Spodoptera exigua TaxID=7107 RepID=A0A835GM46_SPOEX|nr:hypothetical protein HW555_003429 [Spodoptera exigua]